GLIRQGMGFHVDFIVLNISRNNITGVILESIGKMVALESLDLSRNQLSANIPVELLNLTLRNFRDLKKNRGGKIAELN
ncbi:hypothetical protein KI387_037386, partial [Taxus chinensis]